MVAKPIDRFYNSGRTSYGGDGALSQSNNDDFRMGFEVLLGAVVREGAVQNAEVNPERLLVLERAYNGFRAVFDDGANVELKLHPAFRSGGLTAEVSGVSFDKTKVLRLAETLKDCDTFEVLPLTNGNVVVTATVKQVFK